MFLQKEIILLKWEQGDISLDENKIADGQIALI